MGVCVGVNGDFGFLEWVAVLRFWPSFRWFWVFPHWPSGRRGGIEREGKGKLMERGFKFKEKKKKKKKKKKAATYILMSLI